jgi:glycosyltransferase involved in cell wall biosynthesis
MKTLNAKSRNKKLSDEDFVGVAATASGGISLVIPAFNEADVIEQTLLRLPKGIFSKVIVADNGSTDGTGEKAGRAGALVVRAEMKGYGAACLKALELCGDGEILVFLQADGSEDAAEAEDLVAPILRGEADLVLGSRVLGHASPGALRPHQKFGNWLATRLLAWFWGFRYTDLGPFRAIRAGDLRRLGMRELRYGWTVEMQMRALDAGLRVREVPVRYGYRVAGTEKVSGNWRASAAAGWTIIWVLLRGAWRRRP